MSETPSQGAGRCRCWGSKITTYLDTLNNPEKRKTKDETRNAMAGGGPMPLLGQQDNYLEQIGRCKATWKGEFKHEAGPPNHRDDKVDSDQ